MAKLTKRVVDATKVEGDKPKFVWDRELRGFGLRVSPGGTKAFIVQYRLDGRDQRVTLGRYGVLTVDEARGQARQLLAAVARGENPKRKRSKQQPTVREFAQQFIREHVSKRKAATQEQYKGLIHNYIEPKLGDLRVLDVGRSDIAELHQSMSDKPYAANRTLAVLSKMLTYAEMEGYRHENTNPCRLVERYEESARERYLSLKELQKLEDQLRKRQAAEPSVVLAIRLLLLTGARVSEILTLRWENIDSSRGVFCLPDSKSGGKDIPVSETALDMLKSVPEDERGEWVIPGRFEGRPLSGLRHQWERIRTDAELEGVRIHDLRHTFASIGASMGHSLPMLGGLLGHTQAATTQRYAHLYQDPLRAAADQIAERVTTAMATGGDRATKHQRPRARGQRVGTRRSRNFRAARHS